MSLPALSRVARSLLSRRIYSQSPGALSRWTSAGARARTLPLLHRNLGDAATHTAGRRISFSFFSRRNHKLNTAMAIATFSAIGSQIWRTSEITAERKEEVDWVEAGVVSPVVREQRHCGCCWAMAVIGSVEALHYMKTKQQIMLSVQELVDCVSENYGCSGGYSQPALKYIKKKGLSSESSYGYMDTSQRLCWKGNKPVVATISGFNTVYRTEEALEEAVAKQPVIVVLQWPPSMNSYKGGIIDYKYVPPNQPNGTTTLPNGTTLDWHYVLVVGYGTDSDGVKFWRFKNSWGEDWGEGGYGRIRRHVADEKGVLGILAYPAEYPVQ